MYEFWQIRFDLHLRNENYSRQELIIRKKEGKKEMRENKNLC